MSEGRRAIATAEEIRAIYRRAIDAIEEIDNEGEDLDSPHAAARRRRNGWRLGAALEALRFCCVAAGELGDPALVGLVAEALDEQARFNDHAYDHITTMSLSLGVLLEAGAPASAEVRELARHSDPRVRGAVAGGLRPSGERAIEVLEALAADPVADVRNEAKGSLSAVRDVPWWHGKLPRDPVGRVPEAQLAELKPVFERLSTLLDQRRHSLAQREGELVELAAALPDPLAVELAEVLHGVTDRWRTRFPAVLALMLSRPGGVAAFARLCAAWSDDRAGHVDAKSLAAPLQALPIPARAAACRELAALAAALPTSSRTAFAGTPARLAAECAGLAWPPGEDLTPLLDALLSIPPREGSAIDWVVTGLERALGAEGADPAPVLARALEARLAGYPGSWRNIGRSVDLLLERASGPALRAAAEEAILRDDSALAAWGIAQLVGAAHDPARDAPPPEVLRRFLEEPRYRPVVLGAPALRRRAGAHLRAELRAGRLEHEEAAIAMEVAGDLWGSVGAGVMLPLVRNPEGLDEARRKARAAVELFLGPPEHRSPPTDEEWAALRAARARAVAREGKVLGRHLFPLPEGPWSPEDRAVLDAALALLRGGDAELAVPIALALTRKPAHADLPLFAELLARADAEDRRYLGVLQSTLREALGLPSTPPPAAEPSGAPLPASNAPPRAGEWMDEEEDDDDDEP